MENVTNISLVVMEEHYGAIDSNDSKWYGYSIIKLFSYPYTLQSE